MTAGLKYVGPMSLVFAIIGIFIVPMFSWIGMKFKVVFLKLFGLDNFSSMDFPEVGVIIGEEGSVLITFGR